MRTRTPRIPSSFTSYGSFVIVALSALGCAREPSRDAPSKASANVSPPLVERAATAAAAETRPASLAGMPGPIVPEPGFEPGAGHAPKPPAVGVKSSGKTGELLEADVYFFKLHSLRPCGTAPDPAAAEPTARRVVAAEVEITAKQDFNVNPRDVAIGVGGIVFDGSIDQKRRVEGCAPLLKISVLRPKQVAKGFVLFDIPVTGPGSDLGEMNLAYRPTRFGGAGHVLVNLREK